MCFSLAFFLLRKRAFHLIQRLVCVCVCCMCLFVCGLCCATGSSINNWRGSWRFIQTQTHKSRAFTPRPLPVSLHVISLQTAHRRTSDKAAVDYNANARRERETERKRKRNEKEDWQTLKACTKAKTKAKCKLRL